MLLLEVLGRIAGLLLLRADAGALELLLIGAAAVLAAALLAVLGVPASGAASAPGRASFADVRVLLRASDPDAEGHRRARAPGAAV